MGPDAGVGGRRGSADGPRDPRPRRIGPVLRAARVARSVNAVRIVAPDLAGFGTSDKPDIGVRPRVRTSTTSTRWSSASSSTSRSRSSATRSAALLAALWTARHADARVRARDRCLAPYPSADGAEVWLPGAEAPAGRTRSPRPCSRVSCACSRSRSASRAATRRRSRADYARQTFRGRGERCGRRCTTRRSSRSSTWSDALDGTLPILVEHADEDRTVPLSAHTRVVRAPPERRAPDRAPAATSSSCTSASPRSPSGSDGSPARLRP